MNFSVIVPTFNRPRQLLACLQSLDQLAYPCHLFEVIVVDDGSAAELAPRLVASQYRFQVRVLQQPNSGPAKARNFGASQAEGRWLAFTDDDCSPAPEWLQQLQVSLEASPGGLVAGGTWNRCPGNLCSVANQLLIETVCGWFAEFAPERLFFTSNNFAADRRRFLNLGGFDTRFSLAAGEDREFCMRWFRAGGELLRRPEAVLLHGHPQGFFRFTRMHFRYGRGAATLHSILPMTPLKVSRLSLYLRLMVAPFRAVPLSQALICLPLLAWSQVVSALGFAFESYVSGSRAPGTSGGTGLSGNVASRSARAGSSS